MELEVTAPVIEWRGPAPFLFVRLPDDDADHVQRVAQAVTYGWGMVPVTVTLGATTWTTSLWPREGSFMVPLKAWVRRAEGVELGDVLTVTLAIAV